MGLSVIQLPLVNLGGGNQSVYNAVHNPIIFKFRRVDLEIDHIEIGSGTETQADIYPDDDSDVNFLAIESGDKIYVINSEVTGLFTVLLADSVKVRIQLPAGYVAGTYPSGYFNLPYTIKNYRVEAQIGLVVDGDLVPHVTTEWVPGPDGIVEMDVAPYLKSLLPFANEYDYETINAKDTNLSNLFGVTIRQVWTGYEGEEFGSVGTYCFTNSARQIGDTYGGNMAEFVPFASLETAKFISGFVNPRYWLGYPFDLQFINSHVDITQRQTIARDINGSGGLQIGADLELLQYDFINRMLLSDVVDPGSYYIDVFMTMGSTRVTETKRVKLETPCTNPVYLCWKTKNGGWDYWQFEYNQKHKRAIGDMQTFEQYITDFADATSRIEVLSKTAVPSIVLGASAVPKNDIYYNEQYPGLTGLLDSPKALMLKNPDTWDDDGPVWITVAPKTGVFTILETNAANSSIELEIVLPYIQTENQ